MIKKKFLFWILNEMQYKVKNKKVVRKLIKKFLKFHRMLFYCISYLTHSRRVLNFYRDFPDMRGVCCCKCGIKGEKNIKSCWLSRKKIPIRTRTCLDAKNRICAKIFLSLNSWCRHNQVSHQNINHIWRRVSFMVIIFGDLWIEI